MMAVAIVGERLARARRPGRSRRSTSWILAGGSCCLVGDGELPGPLAEMVARARLADPEPADGAGAAHLRLRYGLGRLVVAKPDGEEGQGSAAEKKAAWAATSAFLWKMRCTWANAIARSGTWGRPTVDSQGRPVHGQRNWNRGYRSIMRLDGELTQLLWPEHVHAVPFAIILAVFVVFILLIGPGEWFLLGWLRARRFTWLVFPALAILCTWAMAWISRLYLGSNDVRQKLEIVDVGAGGMILRRNRFELLFTGATRQVEDEVHDALRSPLANGRSSQSPSGDSGPARAAEYHGSLPGQYHFTQTIAQWTPTLVRESSLSAPPLPWPLDLDGIRQPGDVDGFAQKWLAAGSRTAAVVLLRAGRDAQRWGDQGLLNMLQFADRRSYAEADLFTMVTIHPKEGAFALIGRMSPAGGALYDDLPILDDSDPDEFAVVCLEHRAEAKWMVRRLFHAAAARPAAPH